MKKIVFMSLDERPCNYNFPLEMPKANYNIVLPPKELMGDKKKPGKLEELKNWILKEVVDADYAIISLDTLLYGGIVPSRLHFQSKEELIARLNIIPQIKKLNKKINLYCFQLIMRCPCYSLSDEEPDYYDECGAEIHQYGKYKHLTLLQRMTEEDKLKFNEVTKKIKKEYLQDFEDRREKNIQILMRSLEFVNDGTIDFFIVPQDDSAEFGYTSLDQLKVREYIKSNHLHSQISMYPSADDTGLTMLAHAVADMNKYQPKIFVHYASSKGPMVIPSFEDRIVDETIKFQIRSANCIRVYSLQEADILLAVNIGSKMLTEEEPGFNIAYDVERNLAEYIDQIKYALSLGKQVSVADVAYCNKGDIELVKLLDKEDLLLKISYAGWNTSSNTLGTTICQAVNFFFGKNITEQNKFLALRYYEDVAYCAYVKQYVTNNILPAYGLNYFDAKEQKGIVSQDVKKCINDFMSKEFPSIYNIVEDIDVSMPWRRMFEVEVKIKLK